MAVFLNPPATDRTKGVKEPCSISQTGSSFIHCVYAVLWLATTDDVLAYMEIPLPEEDDKSEDGFEGYRD